MAKEERRCLGGDTKSGVGALAHIPALEALPPIATSASSQEAISNPSLVPHPPPSFVPPSPTTLRPLCGQQSESLASVMIGEALLDVPDQEKAFRLAFSFFLFRSCLFGPRVLATASSWGLDFLFLSCSYILRLRPSGPLFWPLAVHLSRILPGLAFYLAYCWSRPPLPILMATLRCVHQMEKPRWRWCQPLPPARLARFEVAVGQGRMRCWLGSSTGFIFFHQNRLHILCARTGERVERCHTVIIPVRRQ